MFNKYCPDVTMHREKNNLLAIPASQFLKLDLNIDKDVRPL